MSPNASHITHPIVKLTCKEPMVKEGWGRKVCPRRQLVSGLQDCKPYKQHFMLLYVQFVRNHKHFPKIKHQHPLSFWSSSNSIHVLPLLRSVPFGWGVSLFAARDIEEEQKSSSDLCYMSLQCRHCYWSHFTLALQLPLQPVRFPVLGVWYIKPKCELLSRIYCNFAFLVGNQSTHLKP